MPNIHNPDDLKSNCVFVTLSRLLNKPYRSLIDDLGLMDAEEPSDMSINMHVLKWWQWKVREKYHAYVRFYLVPADNNKSSRDLCEEKLAEWEVESLGFLYTHHQGNHAIVFENHNFYDWQNDEEFADDPENPMALLCVDPPK